MSSRLVLIAAALLAGAGWCGVVSAQEPALRPALVCDAPLYDFGRVDQSAVITNVFTLRNRGAVTFAAGRIRTGCSCTTAWIDRRMIGPGESAQLTVVFRAERQRGPQQKKVFLMSDHGEEPAVTVRLQGTVLAPAGAQAVP